MQILSEAAPRGRPSARRERERAWWPLAALLVTLLLVALDSADAHGAGIHALLDWRASNIGDPWPSVVAAGRRAAGASMYGDFNAVGSSFIYPPLAALPYAPLAGWSYEAVHHALSLASRAAWLGCVALTGALAWDRRRAVASAGFVAAGALLFYPLLRAVELNQSTLLVALAIGGALVLAESGREAQAGAAFALAAMFKPQLALVIPLLAWRSRRFALAGAGALGAIGAASLAYGGVANHVRYVTAVLPAVAGGYSFYPNQSWSGLFLRLSGADPFDFAIPAASPAVRAVSTVAAIGVLGTGAWWLRRQRARAAGSDLALTIALAWLIVTLASPVSWEHHYAPALFVFALLFRRAEELPGRAFALACAAFVLLAGYVDVRGFHGAWGHLAMSYGMLGGILLAFGVGRTIEGGGDSLPRCAPAPRD